MILYYFIMTYVNFVKICRDTPTLSSMKDLVTTRLQFRQWKESDFNQIAEFYQDPVNSRFVGGMKSAEASWRLMATYIGHYELKGYSYLAIDSKETQALIGTVGLWNSEPWPEPELGYWLLPQAQGKGYALEAGTAVLEFARSLNLPSLVSYIDPQNVPSKKLALKLGAIHSGEIPLLDFGPHEVYRYW